eukprot:1856966-Rhodomonas_salina.1
MPKAELNQVYPPTPELSSVWYWRSVSAYTCSTHYQERKQCICVRVQYAESGTDVRRMVGQMRLLLRKQLDPNAQFSEV